MNEAPGETASEISPPPGLLDNALRWRCIGPHRGGRVVAVAGDVSDPLVFYLGGVGAVWKTTDAGTYWENISDGFLQVLRPWGRWRSPSPTLGSSTWGMGESCAAVPRLHLDLSCGRRVQVPRWRQDMGEHGAGRHATYPREFASTPKDPDLVYVAVPGQFEGPHEERGVYRSKDGGRHWDRVLFRSEKAGAIDLSMDANNPRILYAAIWEFQRNFWNSYNGGPDSSPGQVRGRRATLGQS